MARCLLLLFSLLSLPAWSQVNIGYRPTDTIPVTQNGAQLNNAWAGGFNAPQFSSIDLNNDNLPDLFVFERQGNLVKTFINQGGTSATNNYLHAPEYQNKFPELQDFALLRDYNCDGKDDIFTYTTGGFKVYRNVSNTEIEFVEAKDILVADFGPGPSFIYTLPVDLPAVTDMDGDGDMDICSFGSSQLTDRVVYYRNLSVEEGHGCDSLIFRVEDFCWGKISEDPLTNQVVLNDSCEDVFRLSNPRHAGSTLLMLDMDADQDKELVLGDITFPNMVLVTNGGTIDTAYATAFDTAFPTSFPVDLDFFPAGYHVDLNNDQIRDLLVSPNSANATENHKNVWHYINQGTDDAPNFQFSGDRFLSDEMIEVGAGCHPAFFDENGDGLLDMVLGNESYYDPLGASISQLALYRNTGTLQVPTFELIDNDYLGLSSIPNLLGFYPTFGDMDGDNDEDLIVGDYNGQIHFYENTAGAGNQANFSNQTVNYFSIDVGQFAAPQIVDVNKDGLPDLLIGERDGTLNYLENLGTASSPLFDQAQMVSNFGGVDVQIPCCGGNSTPFLSKLSGSNEYFLLVGSESGKIYAYGNIDNNLSGNFILLDSIITQGSKVSVTGGQLDGDGKMDLLVGEVAGGIQFYYKALNVPIGQPELVQVARDLKIYPNPAADNLSLVGELGEGKEIRISVRNLMGQEVQTPQTTYYPKGRLQKNISLRGLSGGLYFLTLSDGRSESTLRFIKLPE